MDGDQFVPISTIAGFNQVKRLTNSLELVTEVLRGKCCAVWWSLTLSYYSIWNQNVPQEVSFFIWNQDYAIVRKRSNTTAIIVRVKI